MSSPRCGRSSRTTAQAQASHAGRAFRRCLPQVAEACRAWRDARGPARAQNGIKIIKNDRAVRFVDAGNGRVGTVELKSGTKARLRHPEGTAALGREEMPQRCGQRTVSGGRSWRRALC